jgi:hypothetical protein
MNNQMASSSVPNTPPVADASESKGFFGKLWDGVSGVASAATGAVKSGVSTVASAVTPSDASANPASAAAITPETQVAAGRYNRSVKKLKAESKKLMNVLEGKTRKSHKKAGAKKQETKAKTKAKKGGKRKH